MDSRKILRRDKIHNWLVFCLPIITVTISVVTIIIAYSVAKNEKEIVQPWNNCSLNDNFPPYISDVGDCKPQSSVFTFGMVLSGCVTFIIFVVRYVQVRNLYINCDRLNLISIIIAVLLVIGKFMTVSFQLSSHRTIHYVGASFYFGGTFVYCCLTAAITWRNVSRCTLLFVSRLVCAFGMFATGALFSVFLLPNLELKYIEYNIAPISEWCFAIIKMIFMLTFCVEFRNVFPIFDVRRNSYEELCDDVNNCKRHPWCNEGEYINVKVPQPILGFESQV